MEKMKVFHKKIHWDGLNLSCVMERYLNTENLALELYDEDGEFYECVTLDYREKLPKINNAIVNNRGQYEGVLNALTSVSLVRVIGKLDVQMIMRDLTVVNTRAFMEVDEDTFQEFAKSSYNDLNEFLTKANEEDEDNEEVELVEEFVEEIVDEE